MDEFMYYCQKCFCMELEASFDRLRKTCNLSRQSMYFYSKYWGRDVAYIPPEHENYDSNQAMFTHI